MQRVVEVIREQIFMKLNQEIPYHFKFSNFRIFEFFEFSSEIITDLKKISSETA